MPRCGLFIDLDGTLADSLPVMRTVYGRFLTHLGKSGSDTEFEKLNGPPLADIVADLARTHSIDGPIGSLLELYWTLIEDAYLDVAPRPGAVELLRMARESGVRIGVVTSSASRLTRSWLRRVGLEDMVDVVVGGDEVRRGKPDPEPYLIALERTGCEASTSLAVEDSITGARSAVAAGIPTLLLAGSHVEVSPTVVVVDCLDAVGQVMRDRRLMVGKTR